MVGAIGGRFGTACRRRLPVRRRFNNAVSVADEGSRHAAVRNADAAGGVLPVHGCLEALAFLPDHHPGRAACAGG